jgi:hypothetical protein
MIIVLKLPATLDLRDRDDFKGFKVQVEAGEAAFDDVRTAFPGAVKFDDPQTAWVNIEALRSRADVDRDEAWQSGFDTMIRGAQPYGWIDDEMQHIKAHVEWALG